MSSLSDQSQQWFPTSVQVTVHQARNLRIKGKSGTNDAYAIIQLAKDKFSTSVVEKCVAPVWKEEASFDLPLFHQSNAERCTLHIIVMHRAQVGLDKHLGQAVVNLVDLHDNTSRQKTDWFKLVDKTGKEDKARGEVLLDVQFKRNNLSASMFDLSMQDKPRSRISKLKDKVRGGKKKDGFSDSASAIVPSVTQVLTDSEGEADTQSSLSQSPGVKKKSKLKALFAPKSNLQRNVSQSMSTLGTLPEKSSSLSGSRSSGLNTESPEVKKKFKFLGHRHTGSNDSKVSQGPFSLLGRSKQSSNDQNNLCINGSHVYAEEAEPKSSSTLSLNSSGQGSAEDVRRHNSDVSADSLKGLAVPSYGRESTDRALVEQQRHQEEDERRQAEEQRRAEFKRLEEVEERKYQEEQERRKSLKEEEEETRRKRLKEEEETRRKKLKEEEETSRKKMKEEDDARRRRLREEEEEERRKQDEEGRRLEAAESQRLEEEHGRLEEETRWREEAQRAEEQKRQEEASMSDRLSSLFGMIRKKEEKKEVVIPQQSSAREEAPQPALSPFARDPEVPGSRRSANPFEEIPLSPDPQNATNDDQQKPVRKPLSAMALLNRTAKVSAVKPRLAEPLKLEPTDSHTHSQQCPPSPTTPDSTISSIPESPVTFSNLHSSLAPPRQSSSDSSLGSTDDLSFVGSSPTMSDQKRRAPLPPAQDSHTGGYLSPIREIENPGYVEADGSQRGEKPSMPLPDYETLFPKKRHGVQGHTRWDHITAELNQRRREYPPVFLGPEMSVDGPEEQAPSFKLALVQERAAMGQQQTQAHEAKPMSIKKTLAPPAPKPVPATPQRPVADFNQRPSQSFAQALPPVEKTNTSVVPCRPAHTVTSRREAASLRPRDEVKKTNASAVPGPAHTIASRREAPSVMSRDEVQKVPNTSATATDRKYMLQTEVLRPATRAEWDKRPADDQKELPVNITREIPTAKPRQKAASKEPMPDVAPQVSANNLNGNDQTFSKSEDNMDKNIREANVKFESDPFPTAELLSNDPFPTTELLSNAWSQPEQNHHVDDLFTGRVQKEEALEGRGMTPDDLDKLFTSDDASDPFSSVNAGESEKHSEPGKQAWNHLSPDFQRWNSQKTKRMTSSLAQSEYKSTKTHQGPGLKGETLTTANQGHTLQEAPDMSITSISLRLQPQTDVNTQSTVYEGERVETQSWEDPFGVDPFTVSSSPAFSVLTDPEPARSVVEEATLQPGGSSGGKPLLRAWVSPTEVQPPNAQSYNGGGPVVSTLRRPHHVKPLSSVESQYSSGAPPAVREIKSHDFTAGKIKVADSVECGPYTQLTQEELITMVVKQQTELSKKDAKITELEEYIDNLLVRVIEEQPSILLSLNCGKPT